MAKGIDRREFLARGAGCAAVGVALTLPSGLSARESQVWTAQNLAQGIDLLNAGSTNVLQVQTAEGPVLIDGGPAQDAKALLRQVERQGQPVRTLFNTHWHLDHTGANDLLGRSGATIIAHEYTRLWMRRPIDVRWERKRYPARQAAALPTRTFHTTGEWTIGGRRIVCGSLGQAHTDGDMYVQLPDDNLIAVGDAVTVGRYPVSDWSTGGWIGGMLDASKLLLQRCDAATRIVPGSGPVVGRDHLQQQHDMLEVLRERIWQLMRKGMSDEDIVNIAPTQEYDSRWGDPERFLLNAYRGIWGHVREMRGIV